MSTRDRRHAVVMGSSIGGLLSAQVLSKYFERVTVLDRDHLPDDANPRKSIPQGRHTHAVLKGGVDVIERLFPGFWDDIVKEGARKTDMAEDWAWYHHGVFKGRQSCGLHMYCQTRPFLEFHVRRKLLGNPKITLRPRHEVTELMHDAAAQTIQGVYVMSRENDGGPEPLEADLVVDATGRGTRTPRWLEAMGYDRPAEEEVRIDVGYASRLVEPPADAAQHDWTNMLIYPTAPHETRVGYIFPVEGGRWIVTLCGYCGDYPPAEEEEFMEYARTLGRPEFFEAIKDAKPLTGISTHRLPSNLRRRYDRMKRFPDRLVVLGDAACSFNPLFGQGMSTAALSVEVLDKTLTRWSRDSLTGFSKAFLRGPFPHIDVAWTLATTEDLRYPTVEGPRPFWLPGLQWYTHRLIAGAARDPKLHRVFLEVMNFQAGLPALLTPDVIRRVLFPPRSRATLAPVASRSQSSASGTAS